MITKKALVLFGLAAISPMFSAESQKIIIKGSSVRGEYSHSVWLDADLAGKPVELMCFVRQQGCTKLAAGKYLMVSLRPGEGIYQDCANVDIYSISGDPTKDQPLGEYCLLEP